MGKDSILKKQIDIDFSGDFVSLPEFNRSALTEYVDGFIKKYGEEREVFDVSIYIKKFEASHFGKQLIFCSLAANTEFGLVSSSSTGWGVKQALRQSLRTMLLEVNKLNVRQLYGQYAEASV